MASPRRARSLFLSPDKAELFAQKEINSLVQHVEVIPRKPVPRQGRRTDIVVEESTGDENRTSTSTIKTVDNFCREYRPPSVDLHRISALDKELPPPPPTDTPTQTLSQGTALRRTSTQKNAAAQTVISIQSRYSSRITPSTPSRLSTISSKHISSQQRDSEDRISIRSHFSTQDSSIGQAAPRSEPRTSIAIDRRRPSIGESSIKENMRRQSSGSISPCTVPYQENNQVAVTSESRVPKSREAEIVPWADRIMQNPPRGVNSKETVPRSKSARKSSVGWSFNEGFVLRIDDNPKNTTDISSRGENLALEPVSKPMVPIRWTFRDGIIYKATKIPKNENGMPGAKSNRMLPIGWSFYDGLTVRPDGSVKAISKATGKSEEIVHAGKSRSMVPIGWTFHEGLIFAAKSAPNARDKSNGTQMEARSKRLPVAWTFYDGLSFGVNKGNGTEREAKSKRLPITWTFYDGLSLGITKSTGTEREASSKRLPITWTFYDGLSLGTNSKVKDTTKTTPLGKEIATESRSKRSVRWTFNDGVVIRSDPGMSPNLRESVTTPRKKCQPPTSSPANGVDKTAERAEKEIGETADGVEDVAGEAGGDVEGPEVGGVEEAAESRDQELPVDRSVLKGLEVGEDGEAPGADRETVGKTGEGSPEYLMGKTIDRKRWIAPAGRVSNETARSISTKSPPSHPLRINDHDQHSSKIVNGNEQAPGPVSSGRKTQKSPSFDQDYRAMAAALALRQNSHQSPADLDELVQEGRLICDQFRRQAQKLQKQKILVDEMLTLLGSPVESVEE